MSGEVQVDLDTCNVDKGIWCIPCLRKHYGLPPSTPPKPKKKSTFVKTDFDNIKYNSHLLKAGMRFGMLTTLRNTNFIRKGSVCWECKCDCDNIIKVRRIDLLDKTIIECRDCRISRKKENL